MPFNVADILEQTAAVQTFVWSDRDYLLYALSLGMAGDAEHADVSPYVFEKDLQVVPTYPTVLAWIVGPTFTHLGSAPDHALHVGQKIEVHRALYEPVTVVASGEVVAVHDKGHERGALIVARHEVVRATDGARLATLTTTCFARDCGGCGSGGEAQSRPHIMPAREPEHRLLYAVRPDAAFLYRLTGDRNPLHVDPAAARRAGFAAPILHGLCTFGMTCRAVLESVVDGQTQHILSHEARFSAPVYPGDVLEITLWQDGPIVSFEARVAARQSLVLTGGRAELTHK
jgi:acyl dehydratase